jgi:NitT/TauT family transport system permease protein
VEAASRSKRSLDLLWVSLIVAALVVSLWHIFAVLIANTPLKEALQVSGLAFLTMLRVFVLITLASLVWVPIGVWVGMRPGAPPTCCFRSRCMGSWPGSSIRTSF